MKILFISGGIAHYVAALLDKLNSFNNIDIVLVKPAGKEKTLGKGVKQTIDEFSFKVIEAEEYISFIRKPYYRNLNQIIKDEQPNVIVMGWPYIVGFRLDFKNLRYIRKHKIKFIYREIPFQVAPFNKMFSYYKSNPLIDEDNIDRTPRGIRFYIWAFVLALFRKWYYSLPDATICYADSGIEIQKSYGVKVERIFVSNNSCDTDKLFDTLKEIDQKSLESEKNPYTLIHIGRLVKWKKVDLLIKATAELVKIYPKTNLIVIGNGPEKEHLIELSKNLSIEDKVNFTGGIYDYKQMGEMLIKSGIYVLAGMGGLSINEAMGFGKPIICSVCDGTEKSLVKDGCNGYFFKENNLENLVEKVSMIFSDMNHMDEMGRNSYRIIKEEVNLDTVSAKIIECFRFVIDKV